VTVGAMGWDMEETSNVALSLERGSLAERLSSMLRSIPETATEQAYSLDQLSLTLGIRLPDVAQTATYWHRGDVGRRLRALGFGVRVELGRVIFVRTASG
jgi:hypothetical protein